jgi:predicted transporter
MAGLYAAFATLAAASVFVVRLGAAVRSRKSVGNGGSKYAEPAEATLGGVMMFIAAYFIVSALVTPQFAEIGRIYRLAVYSGEKNMSDPKTAWGTFGAIFLILACGFFKTRRRIKKTIVSQKAKNLCYNRSEL